MNEQDRTRQCPQQDGEGPWPDLLQIARRVIVAANTAVMVHASLAPGEDAEESAIATSHAAGKQSGVRRPDCHVTPHRNGISVRRSSQ